MRRFARDPETTFDVVMHVAGMPFATSARAATEALTWVATSRELDGTTGGLWTEKRPFAASAQSLDLDEAARFWSWLESASESRPVSSLR